MTIPFVNVQTAFLMLVLLRLSFAMDFKPPGTAERIRAIGSTKGLSEHLRFALTPEHDFEPIPAPKPGDWLAEHPESGQSFDDFVHSSPERPDNHRKRIYLQPLGEFPDRRDSLFETLRTYGAAYFQMDTQVLPSLSPELSIFRTRVNPYTGQRQILTTDVLALLKQRLPGDGFCLLGLTLEDLYPHPAWNFVFGQASLREHVGVFSFARYDPAFYGEARTANHDMVLLKRSLRVFAHETGHMFMLQHCIFFRCVMNGSNHLRESDSRPLHLCPVCLHKLQFSIGFDVVRRYEKLLKFYRKVGFHAEAPWTENRLRRIVGE